MGNGITKNPCFSSDPYAAAVASDPLPDDSHGHSFAYVPSSAAFDQTVMATATSSESSFFSLSGAAISANPTTLASMPSFRLYNEMTWPPSTACTFESSRSFTVFPLQAALHQLSMSGPVPFTSGRSSDTSGSMSTTPNSPFMSGPLDRFSATSSSMAVGVQPSVSRLIADRRTTRSHLHDERSLLRFFVRTASKLQLGSPRDGYRPQEQPAQPKKVSFSDSDYRSPSNNNVEWAQGIAGEDRFHIAVSEEHDWVFVGIYDGFNGPDATDYLFANLYVAVHSELKGVLWDDIQVGDGARCSQQEVTTGNAECLSFAEADGDSSEAKRKQTEVPMLGNKATPVHRDVMRALARALKKTEDAFFAAAEEHAAESPELGLMGSCVLVMVMKGTDIYVMNVGDSRAVLARRPEPDLKNVLGKASQDLQQFKSEIMRELEAHDMDGLQAVQLTTEHSTAVQEVRHLPLLCSSPLLFRTSIMTNYARRNFGMVQEVLRIKGQHLNDRNAIVNGRVKGKINVTRAFGVAYLKQVTSVLLVFLFQCTYTQVHLCCRLGFCV